MRAADYKIVMTIGSWDLLHIGHVRYLMNAKLHGDALIVGVDSDRGIKSYKGPLRPVVPQDERCEMLTYQSCVDFVTMVDDIGVQGKWQYGLLKAVKPDIFIAVEDSYPGKQIREIKKYAKQVVVLPRQAENTSTSDMIQNTVKKHLDQIQAIVSQKKQVK